MLGEKGSLGTNLGNSLRNPGAVVHPGVLYGKCCVDNWDGMPVAKKPLFVKVDGYTGVVLVGLSDEFRELRRRSQPCAGGFERWLHAVPVVHGRYSCQISHEHLRCVHWTHAPNEARRHRCVPVSSTGTLQRLSRLVPVLRRVSQGFSGS